MITLVQAKTHLRVDHDDEDDYIEQLVTAATAAAYDYLNDQPDPLPAPVVAAILLQVGDLFENRERQADRELFTSVTYERLLAPYRVMGV